MAQGNHIPNATASIAYAKHAEKLSLLPHNASSQENIETSAAQAKFITPQDPVIETRNGERLPAVPLAQAVKLNKLREQAEDPNASEHRLSHTEQEDGYDVVSVNGQTSQQSERAEAPLSKAIPLSRTHPLFPELPLYGPPTLMRDLHCLAFRISSSILSLAFLGVIVLGSAFTSIPLMFNNIGVRLTLKDPNARRPFYQEENRRQALRKEQNKAWERQKRRGEHRGESDFGREEAGRMQEFEPTEGGKDPLICDVAYYARRVGLDVEEYKVQTEDGFIISLWHLYNPAEYMPASTQQRDYKSPDVFTSPNDQGESENENESSGWSGTRFRGGQRKYPVLLIPGLLQSAGAYCCNDDDSLAFFLCKRYRSRFGRY